MTVDICKLLVLDYLKEEISEKFANKCRQKIAVPEGAKLPNDHPTIAQIMDLCQKATPNPAKSGKNGKQKNKRKYESSEDEDEREKVTPIKMKKNGSVGSSRSSQDSYEDEPENTGNRHTGHLSRDCPTESVMKCFHCDKTGHLSRECPDKSTSGSTCFNCNKTGHFSRECPDKMTHTKCFNCHQTGHMSRECPSGGRRSNGYSSGGFGGFSGTGSNSIPLGEKKGN